MTLTAPSKKSNILISAGIWLLLGFVVLMSQPLTWGIKLPAVFIIKQLIHFLLVVGLYYLTTRVVVPRTLFVNRVWFFILWVIVAVGLAAGLSELLSRELHVFEETTKALGSRKPPHRPQGIDFFVMITTMLALGIGTSIAAFSRWQRDALLREELEKEKVKSELSFLKAQINPHFFFNTLNNIYSLSFIDVPASQDALHKLSRMMRYLLYETQHDTTLLSKEVSFVRDYIELMKLRMQDSSQVHYLEPDIDEDVQVAPMLLLPYIENAFKHGMSSAGNDPIRIEIRYANKDLVLVVENMIRRQVHPEQAFQEHSGIGLQNTLRRLNLLYPGKFDLQAGDIPGNRYLVHLKLDLS